MSTNFECKTAISVGGYLIFAIAFTESETEAINILIWNQDPQTPPFRLHHNWFDYNISTCLVAVGENAFATIESGGHVHIYEFVSAMHTRSKERVAMAQLINAHLPQVIGNMVMEYKGE